jgi:hypothetical protein
MGPHGLKSVPLAVPLAVVADHVQQCDNSATREKLRERSVFRGMSWEFETPGLRNV